MHPIEELSAVICTDNEYASTYHSTIVNAAMDEGVFYPVANRVAARVMKVLFGADVAVYRPKASDALNEAH